MQEGAMTVQIYERDPETLQSVERGEAETQVLATIISYGDNMVQVSLDDEWQTWEIEVVGKATVWSA